MPKRRAVHVPRHVPKGCVLLDRYTTKADTVISTGDKIKVQLPGRAWFTEVKVTKIIAVEETGEVRELEVITTKDPQFRTVTPDRERKTMKVSTYEGELSNHRNGRTRKPNPFDPYIAEGVGSKHQVALDEGDDIGKVLSLLRRAAQFGGVSVNTDYYEEAETLLFEVVPRRTKKSAASDKD